MTTLTEQSAQAAIIAATTLALPTVREQAAALADAAARDQLTHRGYLAELLSTEVDDRTERRRIRRTKEAHLPRLKHLTDFDMSLSRVDPAAIGTLAAGRFIDKGTPIVFLGDSGTGKTHLLIGTGLAACHNGYWVRYVTPPTSSTNSSKPNTNTPCHVSSDATTSSSSTNSAVRHEALMDRAEVKGLRRWSSR